MLLLDFPNEIVLLIGENLNPKSLSAFITANRHLFSLLTPLMNRLAAQDKDGQPALYWAAAEGHAALARLLLKMGAPIDARSTQIVFESALHCAAKYGQDEVLTLLLENGAEVDCLDAYGATPLFWAAKNEYGSAVKILLGKGADAGIRNLAGETMIHYAAYSGYEEVVRILLEEGGVDVDIRDHETDETPLHHAVQSGSGDVVRLLLDKGADITAASILDETPLIAATAHWSMFKILLERDPDITASNRRGTTALHRAAQCDNTQVVVAVLDMGANIDARDNDGKTAIIFAASRGSEELFRVLLERGADVGIEGPNRRTALTYAMDEGHAIIVKLLLEKLHELGDERWHETDGSRALHWAANFGNRTIVKRLLEYGISVDELNNINETALFRAAGPAWREHEAMSELLVDMGADVNIRNDIGMSPLHRAAQYAQTPVVRLLLDRGADVLARDNNGNTALHWAVRTAAPNADQQVIKTVKLLLERRADARAFNNVGKSPFQWAITHRGVGTSPAVVMLLRELDS